MSSESASEIAPKNGNGDAKKDKGVWLVVLGSKRPSTVHSAHANRAKAEAYAECKSDDGDDATLVYMPAHVLSDLVASESART